MATKINATDKAEVDYVANLRFWKAVYEKNRSIQRVEWPQKWGFITPIYQDLNRSIEREERKQLPPHVLHVKRKEYAYLEPPPETKRPLPPTNTKLYGWKVGNSMVEGTNNWTKGRRHRYFYNQLGWGWDSQW